MPLSFRHPSPLRPVYPITPDDVAAARTRIAPFMPASPVRTYPLLDAWVGHGIRVSVKHENFNPTGSFKVRNGLSFMTALPPAERARGVVAATRGNHGLGIAFAGRALGVPATICVPHGNNPDKNAGIRALGATLIEEGTDYDASIQAAARVQRETGAALAHSTNDAKVLAGAATLSFEFLEAAPDLDAMVIAIGGGSQAVGALVAATVLRPSLAVHGVQAAGAPATHVSWHAREMRTTERAETFADGLATRSAYALTFPALLHGLAGFVTVTEAEIADALRALLSTTHTLVEGAAAAALAGMKQLAPTLAGQHVGLIISGGNIDEATLKRVLLREI
ncbi:MAG: threonine/serine dehydratase [Gemmatimonadetes bacterium]|nr:threonine/serine dehydratase [Gemmatimonadota bacterium]